VLRQVELVCGFADGAECVGGLFVQGGHSLGKVGA
jgi:hypothetical protein